MRLSKTTSLCITVLLFLFGSASAALALNDPQLDFDGNGAFVESSVNAGDLGIDGDKHRTITAWALARDFENQGGIWSLGRTRNDRQDFSLRVNDEPDQWRGQVWGSDTDFSFESSGRWVHFAFSYDGDQIRTYANGVEQSSRGVTLNTSTQEPFRVGVWHRYNDNSFNDPDFRYFDGRISDVRIYDRALSEAEIADLADRQEVSSGLVLHWPLIEGEGTTVFDASGNNRDGVFVADPNAGLDPSMPTWTSLYNPGKALSTLDEQGGNINTASYSSGSAFTTLSILPENTRLSEIQIQVETSSDSSHDANLWLFSHDESAGDRPDSHIVNLTRQTDLSSSGDRQTLTYTPDAEVFLEPGTTYWVVHQGTDGLSRSGLRIIREQEQTPVISDRLELFNFGSDRQGRWDIDGVVDLTPHGGHEGDGSGGDSAFSLEFAIFLIPPPVEISVDPPETIASGDSVSFTPTLGTGGLPPFQFSLVGDWPLGLVIDSDTGEVTGTPLEGGLFENLQIAAEDSAGGVSLTDPFSIEVTGFFVTATPIRSAVLNSLYVGFTAESTGGSGTVTFSLVGSWPDGLSIDSSTGEVSGTPTQAGLFRDLSIQADDGSETTTLPSFDLVVADIPVDSSDLLAWYQAEYLRSDSSVLGGDPIETWTDLSGNNNDASQPDQAPRPVLKQNIFNDRPAVRFGKDDFLSVSDVSVNSQSLSLFAVAESDGGSRDSALLQHGAYPETVIEVFSSHDTWSVPSGVESVDVLIIAGGGGGGSTTSWNGTGSGGGGAGGVIFRENHSVTPEDTIEITVGEGGAAGASGNNTGSNGGNSIFDGLTALGGGGGATGSDQGETGGSGGGSRGTIGGEAAQPGSVDGGFGHRGGDHGTGSGGDRPGTGGGGAGGPGEDILGAGGDDGGAGGPGKLFTITGEPVYYAGGGGGGASQTLGLPGLGGIGGGGAGANDAIAATPGIDGFGAGGGGGNNDRVGARGGDGIVIVRYTQPPLNDANFRLAQNDQLVGFDAIDGAASRLNEGTREGLSIISLISDATSATLYFDGVPETTIVWNGSATAATADLILGELFQGNLFELLVYNTALDETDRDKVETYLASAYGLGPDGASSQAFAEVDGIENFESTFFVELFNAAGNPVTIDPALIEVTWQSGVNEDPDLTITVEDNLVRISYEPENTGSDTFIITIDGQPISNSPYTFEIDEFEGYTWTGAAGDNLWDTATNWFPEGVPQGSDAQGRAVFGSQNPGTITLDTARTVNRITFQETAGEFNFTGETMTFAGTDVSVVNRSTNEQVFQNDWTINAPLTFTGSPPGSFSDAQIRNGNNRIELRGQITSSELVTIENRVKIRTYSVQEGWSSPIQINELGFFRGRHFGTGDITLNGGWIMPSDADTLNLGNNLIVTAPSQYRSVSRNNDRGRVIFGSLDLQADLEVIPNNNRDTRVVFTDPVTLGDENLTLSFTTNAANFTGVLFEGGFAAPYAGYNLRVESARVPNNGHGVGFSPAAAGAFNGNLILDETFFIFTETGDYSLNITPTGDFGFFAKEDVLGKLTENIDQESHFIRINGNGVIGFPDFNRSAQAGETRINGGILQVPSMDALGGGNLRIFNGAFLLDGSGVDAPTDTDFLASRTLGTGAGQWQITGSGGFAARNQSVNLNFGDSSLWDTNLQIGSEIVIGGQIYANAPVILDDDIVLTSQRRIRSFPTNLSNPFSGEALGFHELSGDISGAHSLFANSQSQNGVLVLSGDNSWTGSASFNINGNFVINSGPGGILTAGDGRTTEIGFTAFASPDAIPSNSESTPSFLVAAGWESPSGTGGYALIGEGGAATLADLSTATTYNLSTKNLEFLFAPFLRGNNDSARFGVLGALEEPARLENSIVNIGARRDGSNDRDGFLELRAAPEAPLLLNDITFRSVQLGSSGDGNPANLLVPASTRRDTLRVAGDGTVIFESPIIYQDAEGSPRNFDRLSFDISRGAASEIQLPDDSWTLRDDFVIQLRGDGVFETTGTYTPKLAEGERDGGSSINDLSNGDIFIPGGTANAVGFSARGGPLDLTILDLAGNAEPLSFRNSSTDSLMGRNADFRFGSPTADNTVFLHNDIDASARSIYVDPSLVPGNDLPELEVTGTFLNIFMDKRGQGTMLLSGNNAEVGSSWDIFEGTVIASPTPFDTEIDPEDYRPLGTGITRVHDATLIATGGILVDTIETAGEASVFFEGTAENDLLVYGPHSFLQIDGFFGGIGEFTEFSTIRPGTDNAVGTLKIDGDVEFTAAGADFEWRWDDGDHSRFEARRFFLDPDVTYTVRLENINLGGSSPSSAEVYPILGNDLATQNFNSSNWVLDIGDTGWEFAEIALVDGDVVLRNLGRIQLTDLATTFTNTGQSPTVNTLPDGEGFTITFTGIQGTSYGPTSTPPANAGTYEVTATLTSDPSQSVTDTFVIERAEPVVNFDTNSLEQAFDGDPKEAEVSSIEAPGVDSPDIAALEAAVVLTYNGSETPPSDAGTYNLTATIDTDNYFVQTSTDFRIVGEDVILEILSGIGSTIHLADGNPKEVVVEAFEDDDGEKGDPIDPLPNLTIFYGDSETIPSEAGNYFVQVQTAAGGQEGEASANMSIRRPSFSPEILPPNTQMDLARLNPSAPAGIPGSFEVLTDTTGLSAGEFIIEVRFTPDNSQITPVAGGDLDPVVYEVLIRVAGDLYWWPQQGVHPGEEGDGNWNLTSSNWNTQADGQGDQIRWIQTSNAIFPAASAEISNITVNLPPGGSVSATSLETDHDGRVEFRGADASLLNILDGEDSIRVLTHGGELMFRNGTRIIADNGLTLYGEMNNRHTTFFSFNSDAPQHRISGSLIVREDSQGAIQLSRWDFRHNSWGIHGYTGAVLDVRSSETDVFISRGGAWRPDGSRFRGIEAVEGVRIRNSSSGAVMLALETPAGNSHNFRGEVEGGQRVFLIKEGGGTQIFSGSSPDWGNGDDDELSTITLLEGRLVVEDSMALGQANVPVSVAGTGFASATLELGEGVVLDKNSVDLLTDARLAGSGTLLNTPQIRTNSTLGILPGQDDSVGTFSFGDAIEKNGLFLVDRGSGLASYNLTTDQTEVLPTTLNIDFNDMAFGNGVYLAVADGGTIYRSTDGVEWTDVPLGGISANLNAITYGDGKFVIVGSQRTWVTTTDGLSFNDGAILQSNTIFNDVFYGDGLFVAVGTSRRVYSSPDGENWNNAGDDFPDTLGSLIAWTAGAYVPNEDNNLPAMYVIGGPNGLLLYTTFFESWEFLQPSSGGLGTINAIVPSPVGFSESMLYASSSNGTVLDVMGLLEEEEDSDAEFLVFDSQSTSVGTGSLNDIIALPGRLLTVGNGGQAYVSFNGEEWESIWAIADSESPTQDLQAAAFDAGTSKVMMIGSTGTNLSSLNLRWRWDNDSAEHDTIKVHGDLNLQSITNINVDLGLLNSSGENGPDTDTSYPIFEVIDGDILNNGEPIDNSTLNTAFSWLFNSGNTGWDLAGGANLTLEVRREGGNTYIEFKGIGEKVVSVFKETDTSFRIETPEPGFGPFVIGFASDTTSPLVPYDGISSADDLFKLTSSVWSPDDQGFDGSSGDHDFEITMQDDQFASLSSIILDIKPHHGESIWNFSETSEITFTVEKLDEFNLAPDYEINEDADEVTLTVTGRPAAPASLSAPDVTATTVSLAWTDNSAVEEGFVIQRKIDGEAWSEAVDLTEEAVDLESFTDTGLEEGTTYVYRVKAYNRPYGILTIDWLSDPSNEITVTTEGAAPLDGFDQWIADHDGLNPGDPGTGMTESFWEDGIPNLLRYALGMSLLEPTREGLPELDRVSDNLRLTFTRDTSANEVRFIVQASEDLASWTAIATLEPGSSSWSLTGGAQRSSQNHDDENRIIERIRDGADMTSDPRRFLRLEVQWDP